MTRPAHASSKSTPEMPDKMWTREGPGQLEDRVGLCQVFKRRPLTVRTTSRRTRGSSVRPALSCHALSDSAQTAASRVAMSPSAYVVRSASSVIRRVAYEDRVATPKHIGSRTHPTVAWGSAWRRCATLRKSRVSGAAGSPGLPRAGLTRLCSRQSVVIPCMLSRATVSDGIMRSCAVPRSSPFCLPGETKWSLALASGRCRCLARWRATRRGRIAMWMCLSSSTAPPSVRGERREARRGRAPGLRDRRGRCPVAGRMEAAAAGRALAEDRRPAELAGARLLGHRCRGTVGCCSEQGSRVRRRAAAVAGLVRL
nr:hypothetical protein GLBDPPGF_00019 [uncultured bacterium]